MVTNLVSDRVLFSSQKFSSTFQILINYLQLNFKLLSLHIWLKLFATKPAHFSKLKILLTKLNFSIESLALGVQTSMNAVLVSSKLLEINKAQLQVTADPHRLNVAEILTEQGKINISLNRNQMLYLRINLFPFQIKHKFLLFEPHNHCKK